MTEKEPKPSALLGDWFVSTPESEAMLAEEVAALRKTEKSLICDCAPDCEERINCSTVGAPGHWQCGWCLGHGKARHLCGCLITSPGSKVVE